MVHFSGVDFWKLSAVVSSTCQTRFFDDFRHVSASVFERFPVCRWSFFRSKFISAVIVIELNPLCKNASAFAIGSSIKALANAQRINLHMTIQGRRRVNLLAHRDRRACIFRRCLWMRTSLITRAERAFFRVAFCMQSSRFSTAFLRT